MSERQFKSFLKCFQKFPGVILFKFFCFAPDRQRERGRMHVAGFLDLIAPNEGCTIVLFLAHARTCTHTHTRTRACNNHGSCLPHSPRSPTKPSSCGGLLPFPFPSLTLCISLCPFYLLKGILSWALGPFLGRTVLCSLQICTPETQTSKDPQLRAGCGNRQEPGERLTHWRVVCGVRQGQLELG